MVRFMAWVAFLWFFGPFLLGAAVFVGAFIFWGLQ